MHTSVFHGNDDDDEEVVVAAAVIVTATAVEDEMKESKMLKTALKVVKTTFQVITSTT